MNYRSIIAAVAASAMLAGCSASANPPYETSSSLASARITTPGQNAARAGQSQRLYVDNIPNNESGYISFYRAAQPIKELGSIPTGKVFSRLAVAPDDDLYASQGLGKFSQLSVYNGESGKVIRTITRGIMHPVWLAIDASGTVYVASFRWVTIYPNGKSKKVRKIVPEKGSQITAMIVDPAGNLYVASNDQVDIYAPGSKAPERVIATDTERVSALGLDKAGDLYVASIPTSSTCGEVAVFAPGTTEPGYVIPSSGNVCVWDDFVAAPSGEMYALTSDSSDVASIAAYAYGQTSPNLFISNGLKNPTAMVFDNGGNLYVSDYGANAILVYPPGGTGVVSEITQGISLPASIAISSATHS